MILVQSIVRKAKRTWRKRKIKRNGERRWGTEKEKKEVGGVVRDSRERERRRRER